MCKSRRMSSGVVHAAVRGLGAVAIIAPVGLYVWYCAHYTVNVPHEDTWNWIPLAVAWKNGSITWAELWHLHTDNRMLVPKIVVLALAAVFGFNTKVDVGLSATMLVLAGGMIAHRIWASTRSVWGMVPVAWVLLSFVQWQNTLWEFQVAWFLVLVCVVSAVLCIDAGDALWRLGLAAVLAFVASVSSLQGLLIWPAVGVVLLLRKRPVSHLLYWGAGMVVATCVYLHGFHFATNAGPSPLFAVEHPVETILAFLVAVGNVIPIEGLMGSGVTGYVIPEMFGLLLSAVACAVGWIAWKDGCENAFAGLGLVAFGILFDAVVAIGRVAYGLGALEASRYTTYNLLMVAGLWWMIVTMWQFGNVPRSARVVSRMSFVPWVVVFVLALQVAVSLPYGIMAGRVWRNDSLFEADIVVNYKEVPASLLVKYVYHPSAQYAQYVITVAKSARMSIFRSSLGRTFMKDGLLPGGVVPRDLPTPRSARGLMERNAIVRRAWTVLSGVYESRADLRKEFPERSSAFDQTLLQWALTSGMAPGGDAMYLTPYQSAFKALAAQVMEGR